jgi:competence protein ComEA
MSATASDAEIRLITDYLAAHFAGEDLPRIHINKARAIELESGLNMKRSESAAIIEYRTQHDPFKSLDDLKKVPGFDDAKIDAKKDRLSFDD